MDEFHAKFLAGLYDFTQSQDSAETKDFLALFFPPFAGLLSGRMEEESKDTPKFCYTIVCLHSGHKSIADLFPPFLIVCVVFFDLKEESE